MSNLKNIDFYLVFVHNASGTDRRRIFLQCSIIQSGQALPWQIVGVRVVDDFNSTRLERDSLVP